MSPEILPIGKAGAQSGRRGLRRVEYVVDRHEFATHTPRLLAVGSC